ncbi:hypothetical protein GQ457_03G020950 [Hibiscus cannabinus]
MGYSPRWTVAKQGEWSSGLGSGRDGRPPGGGGSGHGRTSTPGNISSGDEVGHVAQRIRACGYEPRCRGFESFLSHNRPKREGPFLLGYFHPKQNKNLFLRPITLLQQPLCHPKVLLNEME